MCRITMAHTIRCRVRSRDLRARLGIQSLDRYYHHRTLRWAGHVARMPMSRLFSTQTADRLCRPLTTYRVPRYDVGTLAQEGAEEQRPPH